MKAIREDTYEEFRVNFSWKIYKHLSGMEKLLSPVLADYIERYYKKMGLDQPSGVMDVFYEINEILWDADVEGGDEVNRAFDELIDHTEEEMKKKRAERMLSDLIEEYGLGLLGRTIIEKLTQKNLDRYMTEVTTERAWKHRMFARGIVRKWFELQSCYLKNVEIKESGRIEDCGDV